LCWLLSILSVTRLQLYVYEKKIIIIISFII
jgi:hypothetical protein